MEQIIYLLSGLFFGGLFVWIVLARAINRRDLEINSLQQQDEFFQNALASKDLDISSLKKETELLVHKRLENENALSSLEANLTNAQERVHELIESKRSLEGEYKETLEKNSYLAEENAVLRTDLQKSAEASQEKLELLEESKEILKKEFENISNKIYDEKSKKFVQQSHLGLENLLKPFREDIKKFEKRVEDSYNQEAKERFSLAKEIASLSELNKRISEDAINLTNALKGQVKTQGNWGEMILERILEESGLRKDHEYKLQETLKSDEGKTFRPDVVVFLPDDKQIIIDSKVSLNAYERFTKSEGETREKELKNHLNSLNTHLKELGSKNYDNLEGVTSLDFVLMFVPIEGAFLTALEYDNDFFIKAFNQKILVVSPSTLTVTLKTVENIWKYEHQNKNALAIAESAGKMLDKFSDFVSDLDKVEKSLDTTKKSLTEAKNKLHEGRGNLVKRANDLKELGVKSSKYQKQIEHS